MKSTRNTLEKSKTWSVLTWMNDHFNEDPECNA